LSEFAIPKKQERHQFFGSTVNRFQAKPGTKNGTNDVGPGSYDAKLPESTVKAPKPAKQVGF